MSIKGIATPGFCAIFLSKSPAAQSLCGLVRFQSRFSKRSRFCALGFSIWVCAVAQQINSLDCGSEPTNGCRECFWFGEFVRAFKRQEVLIIAARDKIHIAQTSEVSGGISEAAVIWIKLRGAHDWFARNKIQKSHAPVQIFLLLSTNPDGRKGRKFDTH